MSAPGDSTVVAPNETPLAERMAGARAHAAAGLRAGRSGLELAETLTAEVESIVLDVVTPQLERAGASNLAVFATGGFGRREFAPYSDLDLVFLCADAPDAPVEELAR